MSKTQHIVATRVTTDAADADYHGAAWGAASPVGSDISPDADGEFPNPPQVIIDISHMMSRALGKQMPMTGTYRVTGIKVGLKNVDDAVDDNDRGAVFAGYIYWHTPTKHKVDAFQASRMLEKNSEHDEIDGDSIFLSSDRDYSGFRFNWSADGDISYPTVGAGVGNFVATTGKQEWSLADILDLYEDALAQPGDKSNSLWTARTGGPSIMRWAAQWNNAQHEDSTLGSTSLIEQPLVGDFVYQAAADRHIDVLGGLMVIEFQSSNTLPNGDASPDDYDIQVELQIEGWSTW